MTNCDDIEPCDGPNRCHGCAAWCDRCGDVDNVCHDETRECMAHFCRECSAGPTLIRDWMCSGCAEQRDIEYVEYLMLHSRDDAERTRHAEHLQRMLGRRAA